MNDNPPDGTPGASRAPETRLRELLGRLALSSPLSPAPPASRGVSAHGAARVFDVNRRVALLIALVVVFATQCGHGNDPPFAHRWTRIELPVSGRAGARADVTVVRAVGGGAGTGAGPWVAGGDTVDQAGDRQVQIWLSAAGPQGPWLNPALVASSIDGPHDVVSSISSNGSLTAALGVRPSPLHGIPRASMWTETSRSPSVWEEARVGREVFGGENVVGIGGMAVGPHGVFLAGGWSRDGERSSAAVWTSPDGLAWSRDDNDAAFLGDPPELPQAADVADAPAGVVVVGRAPAPAPGNPTAEDGAIWWSADGHRWTRVLEAKGGARGTQISIDRVGFGRGRYVAAGTIETPGSVKLAVWTSCDGSSWREQSTGVHLSSGSVSSVTGLAVVGDAIVVGAVAGGRPVLWEARHSGRWERLRLPADSPSGAVIDVTATTTALAIAARQTDASGAWWTTVSPPFADRSECGPGQGKP